MSLAPATPGVYIKDVTAIPVVIHPAPASVAAFAGACDRGPVGQPVYCTSIVQFHAIFGPHDHGQLSYAVEDFFANGGQACQVLRLYKPAPNQSDGLAQLLYQGLHLRARAPGSWGNGLRVKISRPNPERPETIANELAGQGLALRDLFTLTIIDTQTETQEEFANVSLRDNAGTYRIDIALRQSRLVDYVPTQLDAPPPPTARLQAFSGGHDGQALTANDYLTALGTGGLTAFDARDYTLLCLPGLSDEMALQLWPLAAAKCRRDHAMLLMDPLLAWDRISGQALGQSGVPLPTIPAADHCAIYYPRVVRRDVAGEWRSFGPCGAVAGVIARMDAKRGIHKAPAGLDAPLQSHRWLDRTLDEDTQQQLAQQGVNGLRSMRRAGPMIWGARTLQSDGPDQYIPCKRLYMHIKDSIAASLSQAVFYPNTPALWSGVREAAGQFLDSLFQKGSFAGEAPETAYFVKCDASIITQKERDTGLMRLELGFAPLRPNDFVTMRIEAQTALSQQPEPEA